MPSKEELCGTVPRCIAFDLLDLLTLSLKRTSVKNFQIVLLHVSSLPLGIKHYCTHTYFSRKGFKNWLNIQVKKFNICFECALPLTETSVQCVFCKLVSFCTLDCMKTNTERAGCHPCSDMLINKYFPSPPSTIDQNEKQNTYLAVISFQKSIKRLEIYVYYNHK